MADDDSHSLKMNQLVAYLSITNPKSSDVKQPHHFCIFIHAPQWLIVCILFPNHSVCLPSVPVKKFCKRFFFINWMAGLTASVVSSESAEKWASRSKIPHQVTYRASPEGLPVIVSKTDSDMCGVALYRAGSAATGRGVSRPAAYFDLNHTTHAGPRYPVMLEMEHLQPLERSTTTNEALV